MAWTEQCKYAFRANATGKLSQYKNKSRKVTGVLRDLSRESGIPFKTLKRWYYEKQDSISPKNETDKPPKNNDSPENTPNSMCSMCNRNTVYLDRGKPLSSASKYYGLCPTCRRNQQYMEVIDRQATENESGLMTVCPHCERPHYINIKTEKDHRRKHARNPKRNITT